MEDFETSQPTNNSSGLEELQSTQQRKVLDTVDQLRNCGLDNELSLPQLVVCGDQSAGKSSVLEALTEITFPRADNVCTRFATEIILRRNAVENLKIRIIPDGTRPSHEQNNIKAFSDAITDFASLTSQLARTIERAKAVMQIGDASDNGQSRTFARDVLSIEIEGPSRPQLTVVDLPGMIQNENELGDKALVDDLTVEYISQPRTICLAIITAMNDADNQRILTFARKADPEGKRSVGIITKPDTLPPGSGNQVSFIDLASNKVKRYFFKLGWHVLKNRKFEESDVSLRERNRLEAEFFRTSNFKELPPRNTGIEALRTRLSDVLFDHIRRELPGMRTEVERLLNVTKQCLEQLGMSRTSADECREYLMQLSERMQSTARCALNGPYDGEFFRTKEFLDFDQGAKWAVRRLRALIQQTNEEFAQRMHSSGHTFHIGPEPPANESDLKAFASAHELNVLQEDDDQPVAISYAVALTWIQKMIACNRGRELQGNYSPLVISEIFWYQSRRWNSMAEDHIERVSQMCLDFMKDLLCENSAKDVSDNVWTITLEEEMHTREVRAHEFLHKIMRAYQDHPINHNHYYTDTIQNVRRQREERRLQRAIEDSTKKIDIEDGGGHLRSVTEIDPDGAVKSFSPQTEADMLRFSCQEALDCMRSIYKVKQKTFVDAVTSLVVEEHIVQNLENIFSPATVSRMTDEDVQRLASEPEGIKRERHHYEDQLKKLRQGQKILRAAIGGARS